MNPPSRKRYRARSAQASPLYGIVQDHVEDYLLELREPFDGRTTPNPLIDVTDQNPVCPSYRVTRVIFSPIANPESHPPIRI